MSSFLLHRQLWRQAARSDSEPGTLTQVPDNLSKQLEMKDEAQEYDKKAVKLKARAWVWMV